MTLTSQKNQTNFRRSRMFIPDPRSWYFSIPDPGSPKQQNFADLGCLSRIPDPDFFPPQIPETGSNNNKKGDKNYNKQNVTKCNLFSFQTGTGTGTGTGTVQNSQKYGLGIRDRKTLITDPGCGYRGQKGQGPRIRNTENLSSANYGYLFVWQIKKILWKIFWPELKKKLTQD